MNCPPVRSDETSDFPAAHRPRHLEIVALGKWSQAEAVEESLWHGYYVPDHLRG
jgi:hypothetical protein